jgi:hypothetical protein
LPCVGRSITAAVARKVLPVVAFAAGLWEFAEAIKESPLMAIELFDTPEDAA